MRASTDSAHEPQTDKPDEPRTRRARGQADYLCDFASEQTRPVGEAGENPFVSFIERWATDTCCRERPIGSGEIAFELERLVLVALEDFD